MDFKVLTIQKDDAGRRFDKIVKSVFPDKGLAEINGIIRKGLVKLNGKKSKNDMRVNEGDELKAASFLFNSENLSKEKTKSKILQEQDNQDSALDFEIVFQNQHLLFINKEYNTTVHGFSDSLDSKVKKYYSATSNITSISFKPGPLHRLDKKTTGLLCFSWSLEGARWFSENIKTHQIKKYYIGIVEGKLENCEKWEHNIEKSKAFGERDFHTVEASEDGKKAITWAEPLKYGRYKNIEITLVSFRIETGRTHQIRYQSSSKGHPLLGDTAYGGSSIDKKDGYKQDFYLHAQNLEIGENPLGLPQIIKCKETRDFEEFVKKHF